MTDRSRSTISRCSTCEKIGLLEEPALKIVGAVDALRINSTIYDFETDGVHEINSP